MGARGVFVVCNGGERKCCFYSGRRAVIDYKVNVIDCNRLQREIVFPKTSC